MCDLFIQLHIDDAKKGDPESARYLLRLIADELDAGRMPGDVLRQYLINALKNIGNDTMKPDAALNLRKRRGIKKRINEWEIWNDCNSELDNPGTTREAAYAAVAERWNFDISTVKKCYLAQERAANYLAQEHPEKEL